MNSNFNNNFENLTDAKIKKLKIFGKFFIKSIDNQ